MKRFLNISAWVFSSILLLLVVAILVIRTGPVQKKLVRIAADRLSGVLKTEVKVDGVSISFFNRLYLEGILARDRKKDTLLYAGDLHVRLTDWFFLRDQTELHYIGLNDVLLHTKRTDSVWNYQFILDAFKPKKKDTASKPLPLLLERIEVNRLSYIEEDHWAGRTTTARVRHLDLDADEIDFRSKKVFIHELDLKEPYFAISDYPGNRPPKVRKKTLKRRSSQTSLQWNPESWDILAHTIRITNGNFRNDLRLEADPKKERPVRPYFDNRHIDFKDIDAELTNMSWEKDTIAGQILLSTIERSGLEIVSFSSMMKMHPEAMSFDALEIQTPNSSLTERFVMRYDDFLLDMSYFEERVRLEGDFRNSRIRLSDLACFAPELKDIDHELVVNGLVTGTVEDLSTKGMVVTYGKETVLNGDISMQGFPDTEKMLFQLDAKSLHTSYEDALVLAPVLKDMTTPNLRLLEKLDIKGGFQGSLTKFHVNGQAASALGEAGWDMNFLIADDGTPDYKGQLIASEFELGKLLEVAEIGKINIKADVSGMGLSADATSEASVDDGSITFHGYNYQHLQVKAGIKEKRLSVQVKASDKHLEAAMRGGMDLAGLAPKYDLETDVKRFDLDATGFTKREVSITGGFGLHVKGRNLDALVGEIGLHSLFVRTQEKNYVFEDLEIRSSIDSAGRHINGGNRDLRIAMNGDFLLSELDKVFTHALGRYYPRYFQTASTNQRLQSIQYSLKLGEVDRYLPLLDMNIGGLDNTILEGEIDHKNNIFRLRADVQNVRLGDVDISSFQLIGIGDGQSLQLEAESRSVKFNDSLNIPGTKLEVTGIANVSEIRLNTTAGTNLSSAQLSISVEHLRDGVKILFNPSSIVLNDKTWRIERNGELTISRSFIGANDIRLVNGQQVVEISSLRPTIGKTNDILVTLQKVNLGDILPYVISEPKIEGLTSGDITIEDPYGKLNVYVNAQTEQTRFENDSIGIISLNGNWNQLLRKATFFMNSANQGYAFDVRGTVHLPDSTEGTIQTDIDIGTVKLGALSTYLNVVFAEMSGIAKGKMTVSGPLSEPDITGKVNVSNAEVLVDYTKCRYRIASAAIQFGPDLIDLGEIRIRDAVGNEGIVKGQITHHFFRRLSFNINATSRKMRVLNTTQKDNSLFFGDATGRVNFRFTGPEADMKLYMQGEVVDSSRIVILTSDTDKERAEVDYIVWREYGREMGLSGLKTNSGNLGIDLDLQANPLLRMDVVLDELSGDIISAIGSGNMKIHTGTNESTTLNGRYNIESGNYNFNFQDIFKKPFTLERGSGSYISWTGDPYDAEININATYFAEKVRMSTLFSDPNASTISGVSSDILRESSDVNVLCHLTGTLSQPNPAFQIALPNSSVVKNNPTVDTKIKSINRDPLEVSKQATYLIVFKSFAPQTAVVSSSMNTGLFNSTISGVISGILTSSVQNFFYRLFGSEVDVNFNYQRMNSGLGVNAVEGTANTFRENVSLQFIKSMMNDKLVITFGSDFNFTTNSRIVGSNQSFLFLPDVNVEYKITPDGRFRTSFFFRSSFDALSSSGKRDRTGGNISFRTEFEKFFGKHRQKLN